MKKLLILSGFLFSIFIITNTSFAVTVPMFDVEVSYIVSDEYDYEYTLRYGEDGSVRAISHWWLEINCAHESIDIESIYGYSDIGSMRYYWDLTTGFVDPESVGGYTDWVIKWDAEQTNPDGSKTKIEPPMGENFLIGIFGFHSSRPPITGYWGAKDGKEPGKEGVMLFDEGTTLIPSSLDPDCETYVPEPASLLLFGIGMLGFGVFKRKKR